MKHLSLAAVLLALVGLSGCTSFSPAQRQLFNGRDLSGWIIEHGGDWTISNGTLTAHHGKSWSTNPEVSGSWLRTAKQYRDFILELEYRVNAGGNSGIFIRSQIARNPAFTGHEMQILDDAGKEPAKFRTGALYDVVAPSQVMSRPAGEWNQVRIEARGRRIWIKLNGVEVVDYNQARSVEGYLGLQNHDDKAVTEFRNIRIREL